jgi:hypothetical protein
MTIPKHLEKEFKRTILMYNSFLQWIFFCFLNTSRDSSYKDNHIFSVISQDFIETLTSTPILIKEGILRPTIRESRFLLEMSIKMAYIQQKVYNDGIDEKIKNYTKILNSPSISLMKQVKLDMINENIQNDFYEECGKLYGFSSNFVHLTSLQIEDRINILSDGFWLGQESGTMLNELNNYLERIYAVSIVYIMHSVPTYVTGDWIVENDRSSIDWYYLKSKYIAEIDSYFDYKHERQDRLDMIKTKRMIVIEY